MSKRSWQIGKYTEKKTVEWLRQNGYAVFRTEVSHHSIDILAGKDNVLYFIEVKGTENPQKSWKQAFPLKQRQMYSNMIKEWKQAGFKCKCQLFFWKKINNRWQLEVIQII